MEMEIRRAFGCGIEHQVFNSAHEALDEGGRRRLERIARRLWVTQKLRYEMSVQSNPFISPEDEFELLYTEIPALEIYLLVTCLDTLASPSQHLDFLAWFKKQPQAECIDSASVENVYKNYSSEYGVGHNLRMMFSDLPTSLKNWLSSYIKFEEVVQNFEEKPQDIDKLIKHLYTYFYEIRRNEYTHSSSPRRVSTTTSITPLVDNNRWITPASGTYFALDKKKSNRLWNFSYKQGLDEATILRMIIHTVALQKLGIEINDVLLGIILRRFSRIDGLFSFIGEVSRNADILRLQSHTKSMNTDNFRSYLIHTGIPRLEIEATKEMLDRYDLNYNWEIGFREMTNQYLSVVLEYNREVDSFNQDYKKAGSSQENTIIKWDTICRFLGEQGNTIPYKILMEWPTKTEMTNLWAIIRDPCYT